MNNSTILSFVLFAVLILVVLSILILLVSRQDSMFNSNTFWTALGAIATFLAVLVALFLPAFTEWRNRPILDIRFYEKALPHHLRLVKPAETGFLTLEAINTGKNTAAKVQPFLTAAATFEGGKWNLKENWIPVPLYWVQGQIVPSIANSRVVHMEPTGEKWVALADQGYSGEMDLVSLRSYFFDLGSFVGNNNPAVFKIMWSNIYRNQPETYPNGSRHCFEVSVYAEGAKPVSKYIVFDCKGMFSFNEDLKESFHVAMEKTPPWNRND